MNIQRKIATAFAVLAGLILAVSLFASWQVDRLSAALYEVGVVRLPSIQGLVLMKDAVDDLDDASERLANSSDRNGQTLQRQRIAAAWQRFDRGWELYEPLPQTAVEAVQWKVFVPVATAWRRGEAAALDELATAVETHDDAHKAEARERLASMAPGLADTDRRLRDLMALNYDVAEAAKRGSIASRSDVERLRSLMVALAVVAAGLSLAFGLATGKRIAEPIVEVSKAIAEVAEGNRDIHIPVNSTDEFGEVANALNHLVDALRAKEAQLKLLSDNLPGSFIYQLETTDGGQPRFLYASGGVQQLHGFEPGRLLRDANALYGQILPEDLARFQQARVGALSSNSVFHVEYRIRRADGAIRTMNAWSKPRRTVDGRVIWDGIEMDVTDQHESNTQRDRLARAIDTHFDGAYWMDASWRIVYVNEAGCRAVGYSRDEIIGQPVTLIAPRLTEERLREIWAELRGRGSFTSEGFHRRKDGTEFPVEIVTSYLRFGDEEMICGFARDITTRRNADEARDRQLDELKRWHRLTLDREDRMNELKREVNELCLRAGITIRYPSQQQTNRTRAVAAEA